MSTLCEHQKWPPGLIPVWCVSHKHRRTLFPSVSERPSYSFCLSLSISSDHHEPNRKYLWSTLFSSEVDKKSIHENNAIHRGVCDTFTDVLTRNIHKDSLQSKQMIQSKPITIIWRFLTRRTNGNWHELNSQNKNPGYPKNMCDCESTVPHIPPLVSSPARERELLKC